MIVLLKKYIPLINKPVRPVRFTKLLGFLTLSYEQVEVNKQPAVHRNHIFCEIILFKMAMRSALSRGIVTRSMDSTSRGASSRFFSGKGKVLSEEEQAKENVYIQVLHFPLFLHPFLDPISCF